MRIKKSILIASVAILLVALSVNIYGTTNKARTKAETERNRQKVEVRLEKVWKDVKNTHGLNESDYLKINSENINPFLNGTLKGFNNKDLVEQINLIFRDSLVKAPIGSTEPTILVNKNCKEIVFAYKESDGKNTMHFFRKADKAWSSEILSTEGSPIPEIE